MNDCLLRMHMPFKFSNRLRELLAENRPLFGAFVNFPSPPLVEFTGSCGFDWVMLDGEHEGMSVETCYELVRAADAVNLAAIVRVPSNRPEIILGYAETGVDAVLAPHVDSAANAEALVRSLRYWPTGTRGASSSTRAAGYGIGRSAADYFSATAEHTLAAALLEDREAFEHVEDIAKVPGLELCALGPGDLAMSMGLPGQPQHPQVVSLIERAIPVLRDHEKLVILPASDGASAKEAVKKGARLVVASNAALLSRAIQGYLVEARSDRT